MSKNRERAINLKNNIENLTISMDDLGKENIINNNRLARTKKELKTYEKELKGIKVKNVFLKGFKKLIIAGGAFLSTLPYILVAASIFGLQSFIYDVPFIRQDQFKIAFHDVIINKDGIVSDKVKYNVSSANTNNTAYYSTDWEKKSDGKYYRAVKTYYVGNRTIEELEELVKDPNIKLEEVFKSTPSLTYEVKTEDEITEEDLKEGSGFKIVHRYKDREDVMLIAQDIGQNAGFSVIYVLVTVLIELFAHFCIKEGKKYDFKDFVKTVDCHFPEVDLKEVIDLLDEGKIKLETIEHPNVNLIDPIDNNMVNVRGR